MKFNHYLSIALCCISFSPIYALDLKGMIDPNTIVKHQETLGITEEQQEELYQLVENAKTEAAVLEELIRKEEDSLESIVDDPNAKLEKSEAQLQKLLNAESKIKKLQFKTLFMLRSKLSPEQINQAMALQKIDQQNDGILEAEIKTKAHRLKAAYDQIGSTIPALKQRGDVINTLIRDHKLAAANEALDTLITDTKLDELDEVTEIDFSSEQTGEIDPERLQLRFETVEESVKDVISLPVLYQLVQAKEALEIAKQNHDADEFGRVLTWTENLLAKQ